MRFAAVGVVNTAIDFFLFLLFEPWWGIAVANFVSTSAGMTFSFLVNGRFTFRAQRPTLRSAALFLATTGTTMWVLQPVVIHLLLEVVDQIAVVKFLAIGVSFVVNFLAYRFVVWPVQHREA